MRLQAAGFIADIYTDTEGKWSTEGIIPGVQYNVVLTPSQGELSYARADFTAKPGEDLDLGDMTLKPNG